MSKVALIGVVSAGGAGAVGVGGYALFGNGFGLGGGSDNPVKPAINTDTSDSVPTSAQPDNSVVQHTVTQTKVISGGTATYEDKLENLNSPNEAVKDGECFTNAFGSDFSFDSNVNSESIQWESIDFGSPITPLENDESKKYTGCARVQVKKITFGSDSDKQYTGAFSWAGAFKGTSKSLAFFGVAKTNTTSKNLDVEGVVYVLEKSTGDDGGSEKWQVSKKQTSGTKTLASNEAGSKLPKPNTDYLSGDFDTKTEWEWLSAGQLGNIADVNASDGAQESVAHTMMWSYSSSGTEPKVYGGCTHLIGGEHLFPSTSSKLTSQLSSGTGNW